MAFDPDKYLADSAPFNPDAYLGVKTGGNIINSDVPTVVGQVPNPAPVAEQKRAMMDYVKALGEVPATLVSGAVAQPVGAAYGVYKGITSPPIFLFV